MASHRRAQSHRAVVSHAPHGARPRRGHRARASLADGAMNAAELAHALGGKRAGRQWSCRCPAHSDGDPSLIIYDGREAVQVRCLSGCDSRDVIAALRARGLWNGEPRRRLTKEERKALREQARERAKREAAARAAATAQALRIWDDARPALGTAVEYIYLSLWRGMDFDVVDVSEGADVGMVA